MPVAIDNRLLTRKIQQLQEAGCSDKIVWSRHGAIAYIREGLVYVCVLECRQGAAEWSISDPLVIPKLDTIHRNRPIVHLAWNGPGTDLACIDDHGGISIHATVVGGSAMMLCLHLPSPLPQQQPVELNRVVGFKWLDLEKGVLFASPVIMQKNNNGPNNGPNNGQTASYGVFQGKSVGPSHPATGRYACMSINRRGVITLYAQAASSDSRYYEVSVALDQLEPSSPDQAANSASTSIPANSVISHASIQGSREDVMYINAYYPSLKCIKTHTVSIKWSSSITGNRQQTAGYNMSEVAQLNIKRLCITALGLPSSMAEFSLTHLVCPLPPLSKTQMEPFDFTIFVVFTSASTHKSILQKFELKKKPLPFHPAIYQLGSSDQDISASVASEFQQVSSIDYDSPIINIGWGFSDLESYIIKADGTVDFEYRGVQNSPDAITSPIDVGLKFPKLDFFISDACLSPTLCSYVYFDPNVTTGESSKSSNPLRQAFLNTSYDQELMPKLAISLAVVHSVSCFSSMCSDDIFCLAKSLLDSCPPEAKDHVLHCILRESHRAINFTLDVPKDYHIDKVMVNPSLQRLLGLQMVLGTSKNWEKNTMGNIGWTVLNLRLLAFSLTFTLRTASAHQQKSANNPSASFTAEALEMRAANTLSIIGVTRWCTDFIAFLSQQLYLLSLEESTTKFLENSNGNSLSLSLLLGKVPRMLLIYSLRIIRNLEQIAGRLADAQGGNTGGPTRAAYHRLRDTIFMSPVSLTAFERMLTDVDISVKSATTNTPPATLLTIEQSLIFDGVVSSRLYPAAELCVESFKKNVVSEVDLPKLYFYDVAWLGLQTSNQIAGMDSAGVSSLLKNGSTSFAVKRVDALRKQVLAEKESRERRCARCGSFSVWDQQGSPSQWTMAFQKNCFCGGNWFSVTN